MQTNMDTRVFLNLTRDEKMKRREKYLHRARRDDPPPISPPHFAWKLSSHLQSSIHIQFHRINHRKSMNEKAWKKKKNCTLKRSSEMRKREKLVETLELRTWVAYISVSVRRSGSFFLQLLCRRRLRFGRLRRILRRRRRTEAGGACNDVQKSSHVCHRSIWIVILCKCKM